MKLKKTHRILKFKQKDWMKPYIDFYTHSVYGKTMENMRKRIKIRVVKNARFY